MQYIVVTLLIGSLGAFIGIKLKIPVGAMVGAMTAVLVFNIFTGNAYMPPEIRKITQIAAGAMLGSKIRRKDVYDLKKVFFPAIILMFGLIVLNISFGFLINKISNLDLATSLFATAPGGLSDMALIADELGADSPKVALLHLLRIISVISIFPISLKFFYSFMSKKNVGTAEDSADSTRNNPEIKQSNTLIGAIEEHDSKVDSNGQRIVVGKKFEEIVQTRANLLFTLCVAVCGGVIGTLLKIPAGALVVSMTAVAVYNLFLEKAYFPRKLRFITQMATGTLIGSRMTGTDILGLKDIIIPAVVMIIGMMVLTIITGYAICKLCRFDLYTALLASTPGGVQEISMIAEDFGADAPKVAVLHLFRLVTVISLFPLLLKYICMYFR